MKTNLWLVALVAVLAVGGLGCQGTIEAPAYPQIRDNGARMDGQAEELDCGDYLSTREEKLIVEAAGDIGDWYMTGLISAEERDWLLDDTLWQLMGDDTERRLGAAKALISQVNDAMAAELVLPLALGLDYDRVPTLSQLSVITGLGIDEADAERYLDEVAALFEPYAIALEGQGAYLTETGWDLEEASFRPDQIRSQPEVFTALALFFSPAAAAGVADPDRREAVILNRVVFLPPDQDGVVTTWQRDSWDRAVANRLDYFAREMDCFIESSREAATYWNLMSGRLWELFGYERGHNGATAPEIEKESCYRAMLSYVNQLRYLGAHRDLIARLYEVTSIALQVDRHNLDNGIHQLNMAFGAALAAPVIPVLMYVAPFAGAWLGPKLALATANATATLALIPFAFALGSSAIHATIDTVANGGGFTCFFVDELFQRSIGALYTAPFLAALPVASVSGGWLAGLVTSSQAIAITSYGVINLGVAVGFVGHFAKSGVTGAAECYQLFKQADQAAEVGDPGLASDLTTDAWHRCADAGIDLTFAFVGGRSLVRTSFKVLAQRRSNSTELTLVDRNSGQPLARDYYERLGVARDASSSQIRSAYHAKARQTHPDLGGSATAFKSVTEAYNLLSDPAARALYDHAIGQRPLPTASGSRPRASDVLGRTLSSGTEAAIDAAHRVGFNDVGRDGVRPAGLGNYRPRHIFMKARILKDAGLSWLEIRLLMEAGVVGRKSSELPAVSARNAAHQAISTDLFHGKVIEARPFSANNNRTELLITRVHNPRTGRSRNALFKPRPYGDGDGWNRTPGEFVAYAVNRLVGMDYVPPAAYRRGIEANWQHHHEGALLYVVPEARNLVDVARKHWNVNPELFISDTRVLDVLLQNPDRHLGNFIYGKHWVDGKFRPALIDHASCLRPQATVRMDQAGAFGSDPIVVVRAKTLNSLRTLTFEKLKSTIGEFVSDGEINGILSRRDGIVGYFDALAAERGAQNVILDVD